MSEVILCEIRRSKFVPFAKFLDETENLLFVNVSLNKFCCYHFPRNKSWSILMNWRRVKMHSKGWTSASVVSARQKEKQER